MTFPQAPSERSSRTRWLKIAATVWLLLTSTLAVVNSVGLSRLTEQAEASAQDAHVQALGLRLAELEQQAEVDRRRPTPLSQAEFATAQQALDERIARVEAAQSADSLAIDLQTLQARVHGIETRLEEARKTTAVAARRVPEVTKPALPAPPFQVVGVDLCGGERFLSVAPMAATSLGSVRLLREGDAESGWHLQSIEARAAVFRVDGQVQRLAVP
ncbi:hypothetical protein [Pigmentiphaga sp.]|uniref:hypothetical protein n=1 Tax=Pigmentiphaga sp. TaxID=1977564 RepID=UPI0025FF34E7|nr:hypothetical protein [Pigmentiphaga sp.]